MFQRFKIHFTRVPPSAARGRSERDVHVELLKKFLSANGLTGELDRVFPSSAFGILEVNCTRLLADRLSDMAEVEVVLES